jgi:hypothetical protein
VYLNLKKNRAIFRAVDFDAAVLDPEIIHPPPQKKKIQETVNTLNKSTAIHGQPLS